MEKTPVFAVRVYDRFAGPLLPTQRFPSAEKAQAYAVEKLEGWMNPDDGISLEESGSGETWLAVCASDGEPTDIMATILRSLA